jgi:hypothetical protein
MDDKAFESGTSGQKSLRVHLVNPPDPVPWRTRQEYLDDRQAAADAAERQKEAHKALMRQVKTQTVQMWIAFVAMLIAAGVLLVQTLNLRRELVKQSKPSVATLPAPTSPVAVAVAIPDHGPRPSEACKQAIQNHYHRLFGPDLEFRFDEPTQAAIQDPEQPGQKILGWLFEARWNFKPPAKSNFPMAGRFLVRGDTVLITAPIAGQFERWDTKVARDEGKKQ